MEYDFTLYEFERNKDKILARIKSGENFVILVDQAFGKEPATLLFTSDIRDALCIEGRNHAECNFRGYIHDRNAIHLSDKLNQAALTGEVTCHKENGQNIYIALVDTKQTYENRKKLDSIPDIHLGIA